MDNIAVSSDIQLSEKLKRDVEYQRSKLNTSSHIETSEEMKEDLMISEDGQACSKLEKTILLFEDLLRDE